MTLPIYHLLKQFFFVKCNLTFHEIFLIKCEHVERNFDVKSQIRFYDLTIFKLITTSRNIYWTDHCWNSLIRELTTFFSILINYFQYYLLFKVFDFSKHCNKKRSHNLLTHTQLNWTFCFAVYSTVSTAWTEIQ